MRKITSTMLAAAIALLLGCGGGDTPAKDAAAKDAVPVTPKVDTPDTIKADIMANMKAMTAIFESVKDEASAKAALPKIQEVREKMRAVAARARKVKVGPGEMNKPPTAEEMAVITTFQEATGKLQQKTDLMQILAPALEGMDKDM